MADLKDHTICIKFCFNLEKTASETYARTQTFQLYSSFRSGQNLIGILNVHIAHSHVRLKKIWNSSHPSSRSSEWSCSSRPNCESTVLHRGPKETGGGFWEKMPQVGHSDWLLHHDNLMLKGSRLMYSTSGSDVHLSVYLTSLNPYTVLSHLFMVLLCSSWWTHYVRYKIQLQCTYLCAHMSFRHYCTTSAAKKRLLCEWHISFIDFSFFYVLNQREVLISFQCNLILCILLLFYFCVIAYVDNLIQCYIHSRH